MTKTILITGAGSGIGHDAAFALAQRGHKVIATTHTREQAEKVAREAARASITMRVEPLDITDAEAMRAIEVEPDVIIANAAVGESGPLSEIPSDRLRSLFETNVFGTIATVQRFVPSMLKRGSGRVIIVGSTAGRVVLPYLGPYHMTKYAMEAAGDALRLELSPRGIFVSLIEPGLIYTGFNERMAATKYNWLRPDSPFANDLERMRAHDASLPASSYPTDSVVAAIVHAVESKKPRARYVAPRSYGKMMWLAALVPEWIRDRVVRRFAGL